MRRANRFGISAWIISAAVGQLGQMDSGSECDMIVSMWVLGRWSSLWGLVALERAVHPGSARLQMPKPSGHRNQKVLGLVVQAGYSRTLGG